MRNASDVARHIEKPPSVPEKQPDPEEILYGCEGAPPLPEMNIFPIEWHVETPKLMEIYEAARDPGWAPSRLPWDSLDVDAFSLDQRYAIAYWFALLSVFDSSGPAVFARAMIHTYETHEEDPIRKCFFSITRDEVNHEEVCGRAIQLFTPGGPLGYEPKTPLGKLARNNVEWLYHNGARYWEGFKKGVHKHPLPLLFTAFMFGETAAATLFHSMHQRTTIPALKEAFRRPRRITGEIVHAEQQEESVDHARSVRRCGGRRADRQRAALRCQREWRNAHGEHHQGARIHQ